MGKLVFVRLEVVPDGDSEPWRLEAGSRDVLYWERTVKGASVSALDDPKMGDLYSLAYALARRDGHFDGSLAEFEERHELDLVPEDKPAAAGDGEGDGSSDSGGGTAGGAGEEAGPGPTRRGRSTAG